MTSCVDQEVILRQLDERLQRTSSPRVRAMLERIRDHATAEAAGSLQGLMDTLGADPAYHFWGAQGDTGPKGRDGVAAWYGNFVATGQQFLEYTCDRIIADEEENCVVTEGVTKIIVPAAVLAENPLAAAMEVQPDGHYLVTARTVVYWPFDEDLLIVGEDSYSAGPYDIRLLNEDELPDGYKAHFADAPAN